MASATATGQLDSPRKRDILEVEVRVAHTGLWNISCQNQWVWTLEDGERRVWRRAKRVYVWFYHQDRMDIAPRLRGIAVFPREPSTSRLRRVLLVVVVLLWRQVGDLFLIRDTSHVQVSKTLRSIQTVEVYNIARSPTTSYEQIHFLFRSLPVKSIEQAAFNLLKGILLGTRAEMLWKHIARDDFAAAFWGRVENWEHRQYTVTFHVGPTMYIKQCLRASLFKPRSQGAGIEVKKDSPVERVDAFSSEILGQSWCLEQR